MAYETEQNEAYRVIKLNRLVNERISEAIDKAQRVVKECRQEILDIVTFIGEK